MVRAYGASKLNHAFLRILFHQVAARTGKSNVNRPPTFFIFSVTPLSLADYEQDAEKVRQRRSRLAQRLHVPNRVRIASSLAAALLDGLFEHPAGY